jgi:hypothetical protein
VATSDQIEVHPEGGGWNWREVVSGEAINSGPGYEDRGSAIAAAREARGDEEMELRRRDGSVAGTVRVGSGGLRIVLLREDGSVYGELDPPRPEGTNVQSISLGAADVNERALAIEHGSEV